MNTCSLVNKLDELKLTLVGPSKIDVLCVTESWLKPYHESKLFTIPGYNLYRLDRTRTSRSGAFLHGGGIACYIKSDITAFELDCNHCSSNLELLSLRLNSPDQRTYYLCIAYRPPSGNYNVALDKISNVINSLRVTGSRQTTIVCGDLNIDVSKSKSTPNVRAFINLCRELSLQCLIKSPTRFSSFGSSTIDVFLTDSEIVSHHGTIAYNISDHIPVYLVLKKTKESYQTTKFRGRSYFDYDKEVFQSRLFFTNWGRFFAMQNVNEAWEFFFNTLLRESNLMCPVKDFTIRRDHPPWFNTELIELCANRDHLYSVGRRTSNPSCLAEARSLKNLIKHSLTSAKKAYYIDELHKNKHDSKKFWRNMNDLLSKKTTSNIDKIIDPATEHMVGATEAAELLNDYYVTIVDKLIETLPFEPCDFDLLQTPSSNLEFSNPVSERLLKEILKEIDITKSSGCLSISTKLYLDAFEVLFEQLLFLLNLSLKTRTFPDSWKQSIVIPIPKKGDRHCIENTRPISLIHLCGKILEKVVNSLIQTHLSNNKIISDHQFGFVKNKSTTQCIATLCSDLYMNINLNNITCCLFLDYSKAFDSVSHSILIEKLTKYRFTDIEWFRSYLINRKQCVRVGNEFSSFKEIAHGVPQGSVLGPTLFNLFINDITALNLNSKLLLYADDVVLYLSGSNLTDTLLKVQADIDQVYLWSTRNRLSVSVPKTKTLLIGRKQKLNSLGNLGKLRLGGKELEWVDSFNYLGLTIDNTVSFNPAIELMHRKAAFKLRTLYLIRENLTTFGSLTMAKSMILPYLDYGLCFVSACPDFAIQRIQRLQNRILKCALGLSRSYNTRALHKLAGVLTIRDRIRYNQLSLIHHQILNQTPLFPLRENFTSSTRSSDNKHILLTRPNTEQFRKSFCYSGPSEWNALSTELKNCNTLSVFKLKLKRSILSTYDTTDHP